MAVSENLLVTVDGDGLVTAVADGDATITVSVDQDANHAYQAGEQQIKVSVRTPLSFEAKEDGQISVLYLDGITLDKPIVYTIAGKETKITASKTFEVKKGDVVEFRSANDHMGTAWDGGGYVNIYPSAECAVYGNVMSLITDGDFLENTTITQDGAFYRLFAYSNNMVNHEKYELRLPATELTTACYQYMFYACQKLTKAPALPATKVYNQSYNSMFAYCTSLTTAPVLPAPTPEFASYYRMFTGCSKLNSVTCLATDISADYCVMYWLDGVAETGTFTKASTVDDDFWAGWIPGGWTVKSAAAAASAPAANRAASAPECIPLQEPEPFGVKAPATMSTPRKI